MDGIEYLFGVGDGQPDVWVTPADIDVDGDGILDAVLLDFDGDGLVDDALWDSDGDAVADTVAVDVTTGGVDEWYTDPRGDGTWSGYQVGGPDIPAPTSAAPAPELEPEKPEPEAEPVTLAAPVVVADPTPTIVVDTDGDGIVDTGLTDADGDGLLDTASAAGIRLRAGDWWEWDVTLR